MWKSPTHSTQKLVNLIESIPSSKLALKSHQVTTGQLYKMAFRFCLQFPSFREGLEKNERYMESLTKI